MARRLVVPDCPRIQPRVWLKSKVTKNIRSASLKCAIEKIAILGLPAGRMQHLPDIQRLPLEPGGEPRRGKQIVELHRQREPILRGIERFEVEHPDF